MDNEEITHRIPEYDLIFHRLIALHLPVPAVGRLPDIVTASTNKRRILPPAISILDPIAPDTTPAFQITTSPGINRMFCPTDECT